MMKLVGRCYLDTQAMLACINQQLDLMQGALARLSDEFSSRILLGRLDYVPC